MRNVTALRVGEIRPSQVLFTFGVGSVVDLPNLSVMVMGLDDWNTSYMTEIGEERLLKAVRETLGNQVQRLYAPPAAPDSSPYNPFDGNASIGVPVVAFPRWVRCPWCSLLAPLNSGLFDLKDTDRFRLDRIRYVHTNCSKANSPAVLPVRFLTACKQGHLDDFPWIAYAHGGQRPCASPILRLRERGITGEATDIYVQCEGCGVPPRNMSEAFGEEAKAHMPACRGRRPHLRDYEEEGCVEQMRTILLGASNSWFAVSRSALSIPVGSNRLTQLVEEYWTVLEKATSREIYDAFRSIGHLKAFGQYTDDEVWAVVEVKRNGSAGNTDEEALDLKTPEWKAFSLPDSVTNTSDFLLRRVSVPTRYQSFFSQVVLAERLREVRALLGFTRIESPGEFDEVEIDPERIAPLVRKQARWVPASEVRGEGIFIQFDEAAVQEWCLLPLVVARERELFEAHKHWRQVRNLSPVDGGFPGMRYALLHSFSHALMRQFALECGYTAASIRERIYSRRPQDAGEPMAGVLLYTAASDSEGTLGGLVQLGEPEILARHLDQALEQMRLCASDPLCSEHQPGGGGITLHAAACHACLFAPETSCERGNKYLDRALLVPTFGTTLGSFFDPDEDGY